jgi:predicted ATPase/DNA-binding winged helix-turn-helix (wHTH) protein
MSEPSTPRRTIRFGAFEFAPDLRRLERGGVVVDLSSRAMDILAVLTERPGEVISSRELHGRVWRDAVVVESALRVHMVALRRALGEGGRGFIKTVTGQGYCFVGKLEASAGGVGVAQRSLPARPSRIVGRDGVVDELKDQLERRRFVTVVGPGGVGKTSVALLAAHGWADAHGGAAVFIDLGEFSPESADAVAEALCAKLGLTTPPGVSPIESATGHLGTRQALIVLDTCEGAIEAVARLAESLVASGPGVRVLATSRESLRAEGEQVNRLRPLAVPAAEPNLTAAEALKYPAVQLFVQCVSANNLGFELSDQQAGVVGAICRELDGIALAIELAAGRVDAFGIHQVAVQLATEFALAWPGRRTAAPRQQTLRATLNWSHELLGPIERIVFRRLSVIVGAFSLGAAMAVCVDPLTPQAEVIEALSSLVAKSLVGAVTDDLSSRYRLLDMTRAFARSKLGAIGEEAETRRRQARYYLQTLSRPAAASEDSAETSEQIANVRAVLAWAFATEGMDALAIELSAAATDLWLREGLLSDSRRWAREALARLDQGAATPSELEARITLASSIIYTHGITAESDHHGQAAYEQARHEDRADLRIGGLYVVWTQQVRLGRYAAAQRLLDEAGVGDDDADPVTIPLFHWMVAVTARFRGDHRAAHRHAERVLSETTQAASDLMQRLVGSDLEGAALRLRSLADFFLGDIDGALARGEQDVARVSGLSNPAPRANILYWQAFLTYQLDDFEEVDRLTTMVLGSETPSAAQPRTGAGRALYADGAAAAMQGLLRIRRGEAASGREMIELGLKICAEADYHILDAFIRAEAALQLARQGLAFASRATATFEESDEECWFTPEALRIEGEMTEGEGRPAEAEARYLEALGLAERHGALIWQLRAATSLASLWLGQGRAADAEAALEPVYRQFSSGLQRPVLRRAANCLEACRRAAASAHSV